MTTASESGTWPEIAAGALDDIKVADFSWIAAGPIATKTLADYGATVVRVESRARLDTSRQTAPFAGDKPGINRSGFFADFNTSKLDLTLNLKHPQAREIAKRLIAWADVVVESFTPAVMGGFGLAYDDIVSWKPDIIMLSSSMQGHDGPNREYRGFGGQGAALAGLHHVTGWPDRIPAGPKGAYTDSIAPRLSVVAILAALDHRERTGCGQYIDLSQVECAISTFLRTEILEYTVNGRVAGRIGNRSPHFAPHGSFPTRGDDYWIALAVESDAQWLALGRVMAEPLWAGSERLGTVSGRLMHVDEIEEKIAAWTRTCEAHELVEQLQTAGIPSGVVYKSIDLFADPQLAYRNHFRSLAHAELGTVGYNGPAHELSETPAVLRWAAPLLGEHTEYVLTQILGYTPSDVAAFAADKVLE
jgi:benzylsuccinate CoA-transferase BbsF subunit